MRPSSPTPAPSPAQSAIVPAPARSQTVRTADGRSLHAIMHGEGPDLVVLEAGMGAAAASWGEVLEELGPGVRTVAYDRAGYGGSETAPRPRDLGALAADLLDVVAAFPHERLILVGHSWGGPIVRFAAETLRARGEEVSGVVLVDPGDELADLYFSRVARINFCVQGAVLPALAHLRLLAPLQRSVAASLPEAYRRDAAGAVSTVAAARAIRAETEHVTRGLLGLRLDPRGPLGVPVTVLSGRMPEGLGRRMRDELSTAHRARAEYEAGRYVAAERSGHVIAANEPHLVSEEILRLLR